MNDEGSNGFLLDAVDGVGDRAMDDAAGALSDENRYLVALRMVSARHAVCHCGRYLRAIAVPAFLPDSTNWLAIIWNHVSIDYRAVWLPPYQITMGLISLLVSFGVASLAKSYGLPERLSGFNRFS